MEWIRINKNNLPKQQVLVANFMPYTYGYKEKLFGYISLDLDEVICESENEQLGGCTHYIDLDKCNIEL